MTRLGWLCAPASPRDLVAQAVAAEDSGFDAVVVRDPGSGALWPALGAMAASTRQVELIPIVVPVVGPHPAAVAGAASEAAALLVGRLTLGVEVGEDGWPDPLEGRTVPNWERMGRLQEALPIIRGLLRGEAVRHDRPHYRVAGLRLDGPPVEPVHVWMLADGPSSAGMAARLADGLLLEAGDPKTARADIVEPYRAADGTPGPVAVLCRLDDPTAAASTVRGVRDELAPDLIAVEAPPDDLPTTRRLAAGLGRLLGAR